jgi:hypothetical protein
VVGPPVTRCLNLSCASRGEVATLSSTILLQRYPVSQSCQHRQTIERLQEWITHPDSYTRPRPTSSQSHKLMTYEANSQCAPTTMGVCQGTRSGCLRVCALYCTSYVSSTNVRCVSAARNTQTGETCAVKKVTNVFTKKVGYVLCPEKCADGRSSLSDVCGS